MLPKDRRAPNVHRQREELLDCLAILAGYTAELGGELPDGRRPDVLRFDQRRQRLFIGDAKDTESPGELSTRVRLLAYFRWFSLHVLGRAGQGTVAVCFGDKKHCRAWISTLEELAREVGIHNLTAEAEELGPGFLVAWARAPSVWC